MSARTGLSLALAAAALMAGAAEHAVTPPVYDGPPLRSIRKAKPNPKRPKQKAAKAARKRNRSRP